MAKCEINNVRLRSPSSEMMVCFICSFVCVCVCVCFVFPVKVSKPAAVDIVCEIRISPESIYAHTVDSR